MTVSLADVSSRLNFRSELEAEKYIRDMVRRERGREGQDSSLTRLVGH